MKKENQKPNTRQAKRSRVEKQVIPMPTVIWHTYINVEKRKFKIITNSIRFKICEKVGWWWSEVKEELHCGYGGTTIPLLFNTKEEAEKFIVERFGSETEIEYSWHSV